MTMRATSAFTQQAARVETHSRLATLAKELIRIESVTPNDGGCQDILRKRLEKIGFICETMKFEDVTNLWAHRGDRAPLIVFAGHTDVVPPGPKEEWQYPPFEGIIDDQGVLHGRGAVDMKGGIAAFIVALEDFLQLNPDHRGSIGIILTSDEEGPANFGTKLVVQELTRAGITIDMGIVGEPSSRDKVGDAIKIGRRGSLGGDLIIKGVQGHVAYPHLSVNPIHESLDCLRDLVDMKWDDGTDDFGPTTFQISNINSGTGQRNVIPGVKTIMFNFRFSPASTEESLRTRMTQILEKHSLNYEIVWHEASLPYETDESSYLVKEAIASVLEVTGYKGNLCTSGGTSDGRFLAAAGCSQVIELGLSHKTIHQVNEHVALKDLQVLTEIYVNLLERLLLQPSMEEN
jgi:succinyl-diaminopimelate desuccinylase